MPVVDDKRAILVQLGTAGKYDHFYGNDPKLGGLDTIKAGSAHAHLVLTLDCRDPILEHLHLGNHSKFRFVYPYRYDDHEFAYKQANDGIEFLDPRPTDMARNWPYSEYPIQFARVPASMVLLEFPSEISDSDPPTDPGHPQISIYLGDKQETTHSYHVSCPHCRHDARLIGRVPDQASGAMERTWGNAWVYALFWYCDCCEITIAFNESD